MSRPTHIRVARLAPLVGCNTVTAHRRAKAGAYGRVTRDDQGRSQVEIAAVEVAEGRVFTDAEIARAAATPSSNPTNIRRAVERMAEIEPAPMSIGSIPLKLTRGTVIEIIRLHLDSRDVQWREAIAKRLHIKRS